MGFVLKPILLVFFSNDFPKWKLFKAKKNSQKKNHLVISLFFSNWKYRTCIARQQAVINAGQIPKLLSIHARKVHWVDNDLEAALFFLLMRWEYFETFIHWYYSNCWVEYSKAPACTFLKIYLHPVAHKLQNPHTDSLSNQ